MDFMKTRGEKARERWWDALVLLSVIWGSSFLLMKVGVGVLPPAYVTLVRLVVGAVTLLVWLRATGGRLPRGAGVWGHLAVTGALVNVAPFTLFAWGEQRVSSVVAGIFNAATPLLTMLVVTVVLPGERPGARRLLGMPIGFAGVLVVLGVWRGADGSDLAGQLACLAAAGCYAVGFPYAQRFLAGRPESTVSLSAAQVVVATVEAAVLAPLVSGGLPAAGPDGWTPSAVVALLLLGVLGTGVAYLLNYRIIRRAGAVAASTVTYLMPLVAVVAGAVLLGEGMTWNQPAGALVVLLGVAVGRRRAGNGRGATVVRAAPETPRPSRAAATTLGR
ncbi:DMT family transporter [Streptomyces sp. RKAG337]|uniref:DMT family transporter n=1 Tax=Streptomyces sp. RKAG337 TaxID=2893404 RepID=UPI002033EBE9|nr:DMT family transporter [Streptomyces sp. RKAG337]MCM2428843.1 DMT family transporter [Streptomyces sp. RKAG337]